MNTLYRQVTALILGVFVVAMGTAVSYSQAADGGTDQIVGTIVRFTAGSTSVDVTIGEDNPTVRDFLSMLPLTMTLEEYAGREKVGYFDRKLETEGSPGSDPERRPDLFRPVGKYRVLLQRRRHRFFEPDHSHWYLRCLARNPPAA